MPAHTTRSQATIRRKSRLTRAAIRQWVAAGLLAAAIGPAAAADAPDTKKPAEIGTVFTTARLRTESLQDTPVAATALPAEVLERYALTNLQEIATMTPNLIVTYGSSGGSASLFLRGVGTNSGSAGFESAVGLVVDGVYYSRGRWIQQGYFDLDQIEVLKGPQALYYGKNNSAGLIVIKSKDPGDDFEANAKIGYEFNAREIQAEAGTSIPLSDKLAMRLAFRFADMDGWMKNQAEPQTGVDPLGFNLPGSVLSRLPNSREYTGRFTLKWTPTDRIDSTFKVSASRNTDGGVITGEELVKCFGPGGRPQAIFGVQDPFDDCKRNFTQSKGDFPAALLANEPKEFGDGVPFTLYKSLSASNQTNFRTDAVSLTSITAYQRYTAADFENYDFSAASQVGGYEATRYHAFSQEFRLLTTFDMPVNFQAGGFYSDSHLFFRNSARIAPLPPDPFTGRLFSWDKHAVTSGTTWSVFGEATWKIADNLELAGGARYTKEKKASEIVPDYVHFILLYLQVLSNQTISDTFKDDNVSPQVTLTWHPTPDWTLYGAYKTGFKSGGFDSSFLLGFGSTPADLRFKSEKARGFEFGAKALLFDKTLRLDSVFYRYTFKNLQVQQYNAESTQFTIGNAASARTTGAEVAADWYATEAFTLRGSVSYNRGRYGAFDASCYAGQTVQQGCNIFAAGNPVQAVSQSRAHTPLAQAPDWVVRLGFTYDFPVANGFTGSLSFDGNYSSDYLLSPAGQPDAIQKSYVTLDATLRLLTTNDRWELALIGRNLTNKVIALGASDRPLTGGPSGLDESNPLAGYRSDMYELVQRGRQVMVQLSYRY